MGATQSSHASVSALAILSEQPAELQEFDWRDLRALLLSSCIGLSSRGRVK